MVVAPMAWATTGRELDVPGHSTMSRVAPGSGPNQQGPLSWATLSVLLEVTVNPQFVVQLHGEVWFCK